MVRPGHWDHTFPIIHHSFKRQFSECTPKIIILMTVIHTAPNTEVGIYKRKQESKKTRKQELDQESDQEKNKVLFYFFLGRFLGRVLVFLFS